MAFPPPLSVQTVLWRKTKHPCGAWLPRPAWLLPWQPAAYQHRPSHGVSENWQRPQRAGVPKGWSTCRQPSGNPRRYGAVPRQTGTHSVARWKILLSLLPRIVCTLMAKLLLKKLFFIIPISHTHPHQITFAFKRERDGVPG